MLKTFTCIMCPQGCEITARWDDACGWGENISKDAPQDCDQFYIAGNKCPRGKAYVTQEMICPMRNIATSVLVEDGELPLVSVRLNRVIPKNRIFHVMAEIKKVKVTAPIKEGQVVLANVLGLGADVIATKDVEANPKG